MALESWNIFVMVANVDLIISENSFSILLSHKFQ